MSLDTTRRQDVSARWLSKFFDRRWQVEGNLGLHSEGNISDSPFDDMKALNNLTWYNAPSLAMFQPGLDCPGTATFESCPVQQYQSGGYGIAFDRQALRVAASSRARCCSGRPAGTSSRAAPTTRSTSTTAPAISAAPPAGAARS
jgi:hypothetical protein